MASSSYAVAFRRGDPVKKKIEVDEYFRMAESMRPMELVYGVVREPPAPLYGHQSALTHLGALMDAHVREHRLGRVCVSPIDVVLDEAAALVVQPDIIFVSYDRRAIVRGRVFGAPDLVVEVLSPRTEARDRTTKLGWYVRYGVREYWLVDVVYRSLEIIDFGANAAARRTFEEDAIPASLVFPAWTVPVRELFD
jgi:Uma2 family endonuclease